MNTKHITSTLIALFTVAFSVHEATAADLTDAMTIVNKANIAAYYNGNDGRSSVTLKVVDERGNKRLRKMLMLRRDIKDGGDQQFLVLFTRPADVRRTTFLVKKHVKGDDDRWMYLPSLDLVKRIAAADERTSFVGTHFFYEDISGRGVHKDNHKLQQTTSEYYVIRSTPKKPGAVEFKYYTTWIDKKTMLPKKAVYVDKAGKKYRQMEAVKVETIDGKPTVTRMKASDLLNGGHTIVAMKKIKYDIGVPASVFVERSLRNPPMNWLKK